MLPEMWSATDIIFCHSGSFFTLTPPLTLKLKIWKKNLKTWRYYPFTHVTMNEDHMIYGS